MDQPKASADDLGSLSLLIEEFDESFVADGAAAPAVNTTAGNGVVTDSPEKKKSPEKEDPPQPLSTKVEKKLNKRVDRLEDMLGTVVSSMASVQVQISELTELTKTRSENHKAATAKSDPPKEKTPPKPVRRSWDSGDSSTDDEALSEEKLAEKKRRERNRYKHKNFVKRGETVQTYESLMVITFRTMVELLDNDEDVMGMVQHGLLLSEKASKTIYIPEAMLGYDEEVRRRAGRKGADAFGKVIQEDVMRHFCYDNTIAGSAASGKARTTTKAKKKHMDGLCLRYNSETGCKEKNCSYKHQCVVCDDTTHAKKDCKTYKASQKK